MHPKYLSWTGTVSHNNTLYRVRMDSLNIVDYDNTKLLCKLIAKAKDSEYFRCAVQSAVTLTLLAYACH